MIIYNDFKPMKENELKEFLKCFENKIMRKNTKRLLIYLISSSSKRELYNNERLYELEYETLAKELNTTRATFSNNIINLEGFNIIKVLRTKKKHIIKITINPFNEWQVKKENIRSHYKERKAKEQQNQL